MIEPNRKKETEPMERDIQAKCEDSLEINIHLMRKL
jgi:hypothetical protein